MAGGYTGKILRVNLTDKSINTIDTAKYEEFGGGYGMGTAIFWDLAVAPGEWDMKDPFDPRNVLPIMVGPLAATGIPGTGRTNICGMSPETHPTSEFWRGNFGGRFGTMMKLAGWDGVVVEGKADKPVWINIINDKVKIEDAKELWGRDTWETQSRIISMVGGQTRFGEQWQEIDDSHTTSRPEILCIGPIGETKSPLASLITGSGVSARVGGHAAVFGAKNLKAISVTGTGKVQVANPKGVIEARLHHLKSFNGGAISYTSGPGSACCMPCFRGDRRRKNYYGGETMCADMGWLGGFGPSSDADRASEALIKYGLSSWAAHFHADMFSQNIPGAPALFRGKVPTDSGLGWYLQYLKQEGILGPGKEIDSYPLPMEQWSSLSFRLALLDAIANRTGIGDTLAEGTCRAAEKWGRLEKDKASGALRLTAWGAAAHWTMPWVEWAYAYILGAGDPAWHGFMSPVGKPATGTLEESLTKLSKSTIPYTDDIFMFNYAWQGDEAWKTGIYSPHKAKQVAWSRHYSSFWNESMAFCEMLLPEPGTHTPEMETMYYKAVTGKNDSFADTMRIGQKIWTLERAIRVMHGRSREKEDFYPYMYMPGASGIAVYGGVPIYENGKWRNDLCRDMYLDRKGVDDFKTHFYALEGWDKEHGWPTKKTMEDLGLKRMIESMKKAEKLGKA
jgi:aldehyde:ferredoxin oxidoreductase